MAASQSDLLEASSPRRRVTDRRSEALREYFDQLAPVRDLWKRRNWYYHQEVTRLVTSLVPPGKRVLEVGSGPGDLLFAVRPAHGVGIDLSPAMVAVAQSKYPHLDFRVMDVAELNLPETFDYIIMSDLLGDLPDIITTFKQLHKGTRPDTRIVITFYNPLWEPVLKLAERLHLKTRQNLQSWLYQEDIENILDLTDFESVRRGYYLMFPKYVPGFSRFINRYSALLPLVHRLSLIQWMVARPSPVLGVARPGRRVSVIIPCKNEVGNIRPAVESLPTLGEHTEIIFVDGNSTDGTVKAIEVEISRHAGVKDIRLIHQGEGHGKGDAVRKGFDVATGDILIVLDADLTVAPEDLPKFYDVLVSGKGELINGTRMVYPMEWQAMRFLNFIGNKIFGLIFSWLLGQRITDTLCGTKALFKRDYEQIKAERGHFGDFDPFGDFDLLFGAARLNLKIVDLPVWYYDRTYGVTKISRFLHGLLLFRMCWIALKRLKLML